jgi:hypothetical protein
MINCFHFCFNFAFNFNLRRYMTEQMVANGGGGGRSVGHSESLVRVFNGLILFSFFLTLPFGRFVDRCGMPASFTLVGAVQVDSIKPE